MRFAEYKEGNVIYRDATPEETAAMEQDRMATEMLPPEPTTDERIAALEVLTDDIVLFMADLIGG